MNIPSHLISALLSESHSFRDYVVTLLADGTMTKKKVEDLIFRASGKVDAIKKVREFFQENQAEFKIAFPYVEISFDNNERPILGLATSKRFVESLRNFD